MAIGSETCNTLFLAVYYKEFGRLCLFHRIAEFAT